MINIYYFRWLMGIGLLVTCSCHQGVVNKNQTLLPEVNVVAAVTQTVPVYTEYVGQIFGDTDVQIQPRTQGWLTGMYFKEGQEVRKGSLLYAIDDLPGRTAIGGYQANVAQAMTMLSNKKSNLDRVRPLAEMKALSQVDLDASEADYQAAQNQVKIANAQLSNSEIQLSYTKIKAPITGFIGISKAQVGDYVGGIGSGSINTISSINNVKVRFPISENDYLRYMQRVNNDPAYRKELPLIPVQLLLGDGSVYGENGKLNLANRQIDPSTGSITVQATFPNSLKILRPGQYVKVRFKTDEFDNAVLLPQQAVNQLQDIFQVLVLNDSNKIVPRVVIPGQRIGSSWIITKGLREGEKVALIGNAFINPNNPVKPIIVKWNSNADTTKK